MRDSLEIVGTVFWELLDEHGKVKAAGADHNLITQTGERMYGERGAGIAGAPNAPTGMKLGRGTTAVAETGAGAALVTYQADSHTPFSITPQSSVQGGSRRITYQATWGPGKVVTHLPITEIVIVNQWPLTDATSPAADTVARVVLATSVIPNKINSETLNVAWIHDLG